jgi:hypothetical protein
VTNTRPVSAVDTDALGSAAASEERRGYAYEERRLAGEISSDMSAEQEAAELKRSARAAA